MSRALAATTLALFTEAEDPIALCGPLCERTHMATNLAIDPELLERAVSVSGAKSKTAAVTLALRELIARREQKRIVELFGALDWSADYDYRAERSRP